MFDEPSESPAERAANPADRAREKCIEFCMHAELCAIFEGCRKFDARIVSNLDANLARDIQRTIGRLEKAKSAEHPVVPDKSWNEAGSVLSLPQSRGLSTNDYHIHRRPGEVMIVRWLAGDQVEPFYERFQAHFDAALSAYREEERQQHGWKQDPLTLKYLEALDTLELKMADRYLRPLILEHKIFVLSTQAADEMDILHLSEYLMGLEAGEIVGTVSAPPDDGATESDRAWFFKLFSLRGMIEQEERMCFFAYLQKSDESAW